MEQHPVPQNITGFQFKLVGDMTLTQFGYLASGIITAYLVTLLSWPDIFKWPLAISLGFIGFAFAFMPIEERTLDKWFIAFIKAVYAPTQFLWKKSPPSLAWLIPSFVSLPPKYVKVEPAIPQNKLKEYLQSLPETAKDNLDKSENLMLKTLNFSVGGNFPIPPPSMFPPEDEGLPSVKIRKLKNPLMQGEIILPLQKSFPSKKDVGLDLKGREIIFPKDENYSKNPPLPTTSLHIFTQIDESPPVAPVAFPEIRTPEKKVGAEEKFPQGEMEKLKTQNENLNKQIAKFQEDIARLQQFASTTTEGKLRLKEIFAQYEEAQKQKEQALADAAALRRKIEEKQKDVVSPSNAPVQTSPRVQFISSQQSKKQGVLNINQIPNVLTGLVTDSQGGILADTIITVKDENDNPVRAMKTNKVGQFKTTTPLANGKYIIELEKEGYNFDIIALEVKGDIISPLEIKAK